MFRSILRWFRFRRAKQVHQARVLNAAAAAQQWREYLRDQQIPINDAFVAVRLDLWWYIVSRGGQVVSRRATFQAAMRECHRLAYQQGSRN